MQSVSDRVEESDEQEAPNSDYDGYIKEWKTTFHQLPDKIGFSFKITCLVKWIEEINTVYILNDAFAKDTQLQSKITYWLEKQYEYV